MYRQFILAVTLTVCVASSGFGAIVFTENMGTPTSTTSIALNNFQNSGTLNYSGTGDVRSTSASTGYSGASGGGNVFLTNTTGTNFTIGSINASNFVAGSLTLTFGAFKSAIGSDLTELQVSYSTGGAFTNLSFAAQPTGPGTANWRSIAITDASLIPISSTLQLRWTNTAATSASSTQFRIDDISLQGTLVAVPEPSSMVLISLIGCASFAVYRCRKIGLPVDKETHD